MPKAPIPDVFEGLPVVTAAKMRELDSLATRRFGVPADKLMENAGAAVAAEAVRWLEESGKKPAGARVVVCCGRGANGADGLVAARHLAEKGAEVKAFLCPPKKEPGSPPAYADYYVDKLSRAQAAGVKTAEAGEEAGLTEALGACDVALDALLGTGSAGKPAGAVHHMIQELTRSKKPVLAVDIPSGVHPDTGHHSGVFVTAVETLTLGWPKRGLVTPHAQRNVGKLKVLDIGYPAQLLK